MSNFKKILIKIENIEKMHQKICVFFYISKKNEIVYTYILTYICVCKIKMKSTSKINLVLKNLTQTPTVIILSM